MGDHAVTRWKDVNKITTANQISLLYPDNTTIWVEGGQTTQERARNNWATGEKLTVTGTLTLGSNYIQGTGNTNYLSTEETETEDWTVILAGAMTDAGTSNGTRGTWIGNYTGAADPGFLIYQPSATQIRAQCEEEVNTAKSVLLTVPDPDQNKIYAVVCDSSVGSYYRLTIYNLTDDDEAYVDGTAARSPGDETINVLSSNSVSFTGTIRAAHVSFSKNLALSKTEAQTLVDERIKPRLTHFSWSEYVS